MQLQKFAQSGLLLTSQNGFKLAIDIAAATPVEQLADVSADAMLVSHIHGDHCSAPQIQVLAPVTLYTGAECIEALAPNLTGIAVSEIVAGEIVTIGDFVVTPFEVDHGPNAAKIPAQNFGFLIKEADTEETLYFAGDMFLPSGIPVADLSVTYACLPVGGHYTFGHEAAFAFAKQFKSIGEVIPMHYEPFPSINPNGAEDFKAIATTDFNVRIL